MSVKFVSSPNSAPIHTPPSHPAPFENMFVQSFVSLPACQLYSHRARQCFIAACDYMPLNFDMHAFPAVIKFSENNPWIKIKKYKTNTKRVPHCKFEEVNLIEQAMNQGWKQTILFSTGCMVHGSPD